VAACCSDRSAAAALPVRLLACRSRQQQQGMTFWLQDCFSPVQNVSFRFHFRRTIAHHLVQRGPVRFLNKSGYNLYKSASTIRLKTPNCLFATRNFRWCFTTKHFVTRSVPVRMEWEETSRFTLPLPILRASNDAKRLCVRGYWREELSNVDGNGSADLEDVFGPKNQKSDLALPS
jgi:hypothetical protein